MQKYFILGVGCQKGGTSWLHHHLQKSRHVDMGFVKEYHVLNKVYTDKNTRGSLFRPNAAQEPSKIRKKNIDAKTLRRLKSFRKNVNRYYRYFDSLIEQNPEVQWVGDITPNYAEMKAWEFTQIRNALLKRGYKVRVVFLMRDPVERIWSAVRMRRRPNRRGEEPLTITEEEEVRDLYQRPTCQKRTRYEKTVLALEKVFPEDERFIGVMESVLTPVGAEQIQSFLNIPDLHLNTGKKRNQTRKTGPDLNPELVRDIVHFYQDTYRFCEERFQTNALWNSSHAMPPSLLSCIEEGDTKPSEHLNGV